ncbi:organic cation/carnitine transporter 2-like [Macrosteles quadrilineatus]|uniref:organic cation/carnitine transporter 2-like n=1 Tax=Macrosteles quadrilineatus TaxID=74068 RepID=UPI0023E23E29|nr:organic cation/carnitine transporter 2-like [Macrosteles quadrilineatus]
MKWVKKLWKTSSIDVWLVSRQQICGTVTVGESLFVSGQPDERGERMMDLDSMLKDLGQFGKYQAFCFTVLMFPIIMCGFRSTEYIFTTMSIPHSNGRTVNLGKVQHRPSSSCPTTLMVEEDPVPCAIGIFAYCSLLGVLPYNHKCLVPECEDSPNTADFNAPWLHAAVPFTDRANNHVPHECLRYQPLSAAVVNNQTVCSADMFNQNVTVTCDEWVFSEPTKTIGTDFEILCPEDQYKLTFLSSVCVIPGFIGIPLAGLISDRVGRKTVLVCGCVFLAVTGVIRSFSVNYTMSLIMECLDGFMAGAVYSPAFILGLETLAPKKRLLGSLLICVYFALGEVVLALVMWAMADWRLMLRALYIPSLLLVLILWFLPESVRWLHTQDRVDDIEKIFGRMAKMNNTEDKLPSVLSQLRNAHTQERQKPKTNRAVRKSTKTQPTNGGFEIPYHHVSIHRPRLVMASIFSYYGISQYTTLFESSNRYVSFVLVSLIEVPAYVASLWLPDWPLLGRQGTTAWSFFLCGVTCFLLMVVSKGQVVLGVFLFLTSKFASTLTLTVLYVYTAEVFPTELRQTLLACCSMVGRVGSILTQQTPLISMYFNPMILFSLVSIMGGMLTLTCPETLNTPLPDTIEEAENIGKPQKKGQTVPLAAKK